MIKKHGDTASHNDLTDAAMHLYKSEEIKAKNYFSKNI